MCVHAKQTMLLFADVTTGALLYRVKYISIPVTGCIRAPGPVIVGSDSGILASRDSTNAGCGSLTSPWLIQGTAGQRINITLLDFGYSTSQNNAQTTACIPYGYLSERHLSVNKTICGGRKREEVIYTSATSSLEVMLKSPGPESPHFLIKFQSKFYSYVERIKSGLCLLYFWCVWFQWQHNICYN